MKNITKLLAVFLVLITIFVITGNTNAESMPLPGQISGDLRMGSSGADVVLLQTRLIELGFKIPAIENGSIDKGYFGGQTQSAVIHYQQSVGLPSTGFVGPLTRASLSSKADNNAQSFVVSVVGPSSLSVGEVGTWTIHVKDKTQGTGSLSYRVNWGDVWVPSSLPVDSSAGGLQQVVQTSTFTHSYSIEGRYNANFMVFAGGQIKGSVTLVINVTDPKKVNIKVGSPNGGENWSSGTARTITWSINNESMSNVTKVDIYLETINICGSVNNPCSVQLPYNGHQYVLDKNVNALATAKYNWLVGTDINNKNIPPADNYRIKICEAGSTNNCDYSDDIFSISSPELESLKIKVTSPNGGENFEKDTQTHIYWSDLGTGSMSRSVKVDIILDAKNYSCPTCVAWYPAQYNLGKGVPNSGDFIWDISKDIDNIDIRDNEQYKVKICVTGTTTDCDSSDGWFTISPATTGSLKIKVTSPNGGESWPAKSTESITWNTSGKNASNSKVDIYLENYREFSTVNCKLSLVPCAQGTPVQYVLDKNISANSLKYDWIVATDIDNKEIPNGTYFVKICETGTKGNCDQSTKPFTIVSAVAEKNSPPVVTGITGPTTFKVGEEGTWTINAYDIERENLSYDIYTYSTKTGSVTGIYTSHVSSSNTWKTKFSSKGEYTTIITVSDKVGNITKVSITVNVL